MIMTGQVDYEEAKVAPHGIVTTLVYPSYRNGKYGAELFGNYVHGSVDILRSVARANVYGSCLMARPFYKG